MSPSQKHLMYLRTNRRLGYIGLSVEGIRKFLTPTKKWNKEVLDEIAMWSMIGAVLVHMTIQHLYQVEVIAHSL